MISEHSVLGEGCIVGPFSSICEGAHIGNHTFVLGALIQNDVHIGDYCTIKNGVIIKYGATIKAGATIERKCGNTREYYHSRIFAYHPWEWLFRMIKE